MHDARTERLAIRPTLVVPEVHMEPECFEEWDTVLAVHVPDAPHVGPTIGAQREDGHRVVG